MKGPKRLGRAGRVTVQFTGACPQDALTLLTREGVRLGPVQRVDELTLRLVLSARDLPLARRCAKQAMCELAVLRVKGLIPWLQTLGLRVLYPVALAGLLCLVFWLQGHIWFITVSGNETVPTEKILWTLEENGVGFWTKTDDLDINRLRNAVIDDVPALSWITVNTQGSHAAVEVRERAEKPVLSRDVSPANIVARKDGIIESVDASGGTPQVKPGDVVARGELLISGVSNLDKTVLVTRAEGEITARTWNPVSVLGFGSRTEIAYTGREQVLWRVTLGKKTINFCKTSGISYGEYDKIMESTRLVLPGGYALPVTVTKITAREYEPRQSSVTPEEAEQALAEAAARQLRLDMLAGVVLNQNLTLDQTEGVYRLTGVAECREEIGSVAVIKD